MFCVLDPFELQNRIYQLKPEERSFLHDQLKALKACKGRSCNVSAQNSFAKARLNMLPIQSAMTQPQNQRFHKKRRISDEYRNGKTSKTIIQNQALLLDTTTLLNMKDYAGTVQGIHKVVGIKTVELFIKNTD